MGGKPDGGLEKWHIVNQEYRSFAGVRVLVKSEAIWQLKTGDFNWYELEITDLEHNVPMLYP